MHKYSLIFILLITTALTSFAQRRVWTGYRVYSAFLKLKISDTAKSVTIINKLEIERHSSGLIEAIRKADKQMIYFYTKKSDIDSISLQLLIDYYDNQSIQPIETESFRLPIKIFAISKANLDKSFKESIAKGWKSFYTKYPKSAGLFTFSKVYFSKDVTKAVFYYSHQKAGLNGHGDLVVMERINNQWEVKYSISLWQS